MARQTRVSRREKPRKNSKTGVEFWGTKQVGNLCEIFSAVTGPNLSHTFRAKFCACFCSLRMRHNGQQLKTLNSPKTKQKKKNARKQKNKKDKTNRETSSGKYKKKHKQNANMTEKQNSSLQPHLHQPH